MCIEERKWLRAKWCDKRRMRNSFIEKRKAFDKKVQPFLRQYWKRSQSELIDSRNTDTEEFWKKICRLGVSFERKQNIPMKIIKYDGFVLNTINDIKSKWKTHFCNLLNPNEAEIDNNLNKNDLSNIDTGVDGEITLLEVKQGIKRMEKR